MLGFLAAAEGEDAPDQVLRARGGLANLFQAVPLVRRFARLQPGQLDVAEDRLQQVVEVVGDAAGQRADGLHLLRLAQLVFQAAPLGFAPLSLGEVMDDARHAGGRAAVRSVHVAAGRGDPPHLSVGAPDAALDAPFALRGDGLPEAEVDRLAILGQHVLQQLLPRPRRARLLVAEDEVVERSAVAGVFLQVELPGADAAGLQREGEPLLALLHGGLLRAQIGGHLVERGAHVRQFVAAREHRRRAQFARGQLAGGAHQARGATGHRAVEVEPRRQAQQQRGAAHEGGAIGQRHPLGFHRRQQVGLGEQHPGAR